eukprot:jgi/Mesen1/6133/ME000313S05256
MAARALLLCPPAVFAALAPFSCSLSRLSSRHNTSSASLFAEKKCLLNNIDVIKHERHIAVKSSLAAIDTYGLIKDDEDEFYEVPVHTVRVHDRKTNTWYEVQVPEDQYILQTAEAMDINLPFACRHGCCTACAVRIKSGELSQPRALGISPELKEQGYALLCVGFPLSDLEVETQDEDEVYWLQFGRYFAKGPVERDDYALELAVADE